MTEILIWTGLPWAARGERPQMTAEAVAAMLRDVEPQSTVTVDGRIVRAEKPSGSSGTWIGEPIPVDPRQYTGQLPAGVESVDALVLAQHESIMRLRAKFGLALEMVAEATGRADEDVLGDIEEGWKYRAAEWGAL